jgi:hypothetical protein
VTLQDMELWRAVRPDSLAIDARTLIRVEFVSIEQRAAAEVVAALPDAAILEGEHLLLAVQEPLGESILAEAVRRAQLLCVSRLAVTAVGERADVMVQRWHARHPALAEVATVTAIPVSVSALAPGLLESARRAGAAIVTLPDERAALAAALHLARRRAVPPGRLVLAVSDLALESAFPPQGGVGIRVVGALTSTLDRDLLADGTRERIARARHAHYVRQRKRDGAAPGDDPSLRPWEELDKSLRATNLAFADRVAGTLDALGAIVVPADIGPLHRPPLDLDDDVLEPLAEREHELWMADKEREGYTYGADRNDDPRVRTHPSLRPYVELSWDEQEKDRSAIRELPTMLAEAGLALAAGPDPADTASPPDPREISDRPV